MELQGPSFCLLYFGIGWKRGVGGRGVGGRGEGRGGMGFRVSGQESVLTSGRDTQAQNFLRSVLTSA